mmetsp:Transcript_46324/g.148329  ORF Transcript_46324/g.148329 Transcript_46324/m.148329 type:complete len:115 (-) Transcript_46324:167-511(-)
MASPPAKRGRHDGDPGGQPASGGDMHAPAAARGHAAPAGGAPWACQVCTFAGNPHRFLACKVCGSQRAAMPPPAVDMPPGGGGSGSAVAPPIALIRVKELPPQANLGMCGATLG